MRLRKRRQLLEDHIHEMDDYGYQSLLRGQKSQQAMLNDLVGVLVEKSVIDLGEAIRLGKPKEEA